MFKEVKAISLNRLKRIFGKDTLLKLDVALTYKCNLRCKYCGIWKIKTKKELLSVDYDKIFANLQVPILHLTGGEPFLRRDFCHIVVRSQQIKGLVLVDTSTNGFLTNNIVAQCKEVCSNLNSRFEVGVSIDGLPKIHDDMRGVKGSFRRAVKTYFKLVDLFSSYEKAHVHINHYLSPRNTGTFREFLDLLWDKGVSSNDLSVDVFRQSHFFKNKEERMDYDKVVENLKFYCSSVNGGGYRIFLRKKFAKLLISFIKEQRRIPCSAGKSSLFVDPRGYVYPCSGWKEPLFNIRESVDLLNHPNTMEWRSSHDCRACFSGCEGVSSIIHDLPFSFFK
jgi:MoaA/NifB/PqqE/SkfB family radical SAM enzyme